MKNKFIKAIKTKQRQLGMDDDTYRAMLKARTGKTSSTLCSLTELGLISDYLTSQGAVNPKSTGLTKRPVAVERRALLGKVNALLAELVRVADITDAVAYVNAICVRNGWCTTVDFADPHILHKLIGALSTTLKSRQAKAAQATPTL